MELLVPNRRMEPPLPNVVAESPELTRILGWMRLARGQLDMAKRQRNGVPVAISAIR